MARKRKKSNAEYNHLIYGIALILLAVIGLGSFGIVGRVVVVSAAFLVGVFYYLFLFLMLIIGINFIFKGEFLKFLQKRLIGFYLMCLGFLIIFHINYTVNYDLEGFAIITNIFRQFPDLINDVNSISGGGIIGALLTVVFMPLFDITGTEIIALTLIICGFLLLAGSYIMLMFNKIKEKSQDILQKNSEEAVAKAEKSFNQEGKIIISSVDDLKTSTKEEETKEKEIVPEEEAEESTRGYRRPAISLLNKPTKVNQSENQEHAKANIKILENVFRDFGINGKVVSVNIGPSVTQYEIELKAGTKLSKITSINREISLALAAKEVRIQAPIPGKSTVGIEIPNKEPSYVTVREILEQAISKELRKNKLLVALGKDLMGNPVFCEINKTPHLLIAGATGSGKSVCINSIIVSILMRTRPEEVKLLLIDPKKVELINFNHIPHLLTEVIINPKEANIALKRVVKIMEERYDLFNETGTKNIAGYNAYMESQGKSKKDQMPYIVVIIDELADLMLIAAKEVEDSIMRITQLARAAGIHLIVATQRPSTDVITGLIKSNIPSRISFAVSSSIDSRTILDMMGAEKLLGNGDMLFIPMGANAPVRLQGTIVSEKEVQAVVDHVKSQQKPNYDETFLVKEDEQAEVEASANDYEDPMYDEVVEFVIEQQKASASLLQRRFRLGYNRAARLIDLLEERGIIGPSRGSKPREVLVQIKEK